MKNNQTVIVSEYKYGLWYCSGKRLISLSTWKKPSLILILPTMKPQPIKKYHSASFLDLPQCCQTSRRFCISGGQSYMLCLWSDRVRKNLHYEWKLENGCCRVVCSWCSINFYLSLKCTNANICSRTFNIWRQGYPISKYIVESCSICWKSDKNWKF